MPPSSSPCRPKFEPRHETNNRIECFGPAAGFERSVMARLSRRTTGGKLPLRLRSFRFPLGAVAPRISSPSGREREVEEAFERR